MNTFNQYDGSVMELNDIIMENKHIELLTYGWLRINTFRYYTLRNNTIFSNTPQQYFRDIFEKFKHIKNCNNTYKYLSLCDIIPTELIDLIMLYQKHYHVYGIGEQICPMANNPTYNRIANIGHSKMSKQHYFPLFFNKIYKNFGLLHVIDNKLPNKVQLVSESNTSETIYIVPKVFKNQQKKNNGISNILPNNNMATNPSQQTLMVSKNYFSGYWITLIGSYCNAPKLITFPTNIPITEIKCGSFHSIFLCQNGQIYGRGSNKRGQLGLSKNIQSTDEIIAITSIYDAPNNIHQKITKIGCGHCFTIIKNDKHELFGFGANDYCQLGTKNTKKNEYGFNVRFVESFKPVRVSNILVDNFDVGFDFVIAQNYHNEKQIYVWGDNRWGQCGHIHDNNLEYKGQKITKPSKLYFATKIKQINCGSFHTILLSVKNKLYVFGDNTWNQCLISNKNTNNKTQIIKTITKPIMIELPLKFTIKQVVCGHGVTFIVLL